MKFILFITFLFGLSLNGVSQHKDSLETINQIPLDGWIYNTVDGPGYRYCEGKKCNGEITDTFDNGNIEHKALYINGKPHGKVIDYYQNGQIESVGQCDNGTRIGEWEYYHESGNIESKITYDSNLHEPKKWIDYYENGKIESKFENNEKGFLLYHYEFDEIGDTTFAYYPTNLETLTYKFYSYHSNGQLKEIGHQQYLDEGWIKRGVWKWFDEKGNQTKEINYEE